MAKNSFVVEVTLRENICLLNVGEFGKEAADVIQNNFYVDDLIKSVEDLNTAKTLVKNTINMCRSGGFNLTKFISSSKELLTSICKDQRRPGKGFKFTWRYASSKSIVHPVEYSKRLFLF